MSEASTAPADDDAKGEGETLIQVRGLAKTFCVGFFGRRVEAFAIPE